MKKITIEEIYEQYRDLIYTVIKKYIRDDEMIEEVYHEVMIDINTAMETIRRIPGNEIRYFLIRIATATSINIYNAEIRKKGKNTYFDDIEGFEAVSDFEVDRELAEMRFGPFVSDYIDKLRAEDNYIIVRSFYDDIPNEKLAKELGITEPAVRKRISRAKARLKELLLKDDRSKPYR